MVFFATLYCGPQSNEVCFCYLAFYFLQIVVPHAGKHFEEKNLPSDLSHISLLEDEKLTSLMSLEDSSGTLK